MGLLASPIASSLLLAILHSCESLNFMNINLTVSTTTVRPQDPKVEVAWFGVPWPAENDWIGMFFDAPDLSFGTPPIKYKYNVEKNHTGMVVFELVNLRVPVKFMYIHSDGSQYPRIMAVSPSVSFANPDQVQGLHLALGSSSDRIRMYWTAGKSVETQYVRWGTEPRNYTHIVQALRSTFEKDDMCDRFTAPAEPAGNLGWVDPGSLFAAELIGLPPNTTIYYAYGDVSKSGLEHSSFVFQHPESGSRRPFTIAAFGDMGQVQRDGSFQHSWDFHNRGEVPSANTTRSIALDSASEWIFHIGDISYAVGYGAEWFNFFDMIEPVASRRPWMTAIGNHEQDWSGSFFPDADSRAGGEDSNAGGECGVTYNAHFPFASQNPSSAFQERQPWYDFIYGSAHFVVMSTEHNFTHGSVQHSWILRTLSAVNRTVTPWLVFAGHRPMYIDSDGEGDQAVALMLRTSLEPTLLDYGVDLALWGHHHSYQRTCLLKNGTCSSTGIQHLVIGMAGFELSPIPNSPAPWIEFINNKSYGWARLGFASETELTIEFVDNADNAILDNHTLKRNRNRRHVGQLKKFLNRS